ncbi:hypothetical protein [Lapidilactobacillus mulanensis]|nr:hypothetical protein [Lapidilactobacillus mulanensis]
MRKMSIQEFVRLCPKEGVFCPADLFAARMRRVIPVHRASEFIGDFYVLLNYPLHNPQRIKTLAITPEEVFFSTQTTKSLLHYRMRNTIFDISLIRCLKKTIELPINRELSLCFGNWVAMHLSGVSSSKCANWVALHHVIKMTKGQGSSCIFSFRYQVRVKLPVQENFEQRFETICLMSAIEIEALHCVYQEAGIDDHLLLLESNVLRQYDHHFDNMQELVSARQIGQFLELFDLIAINKICHQPEFEEASQMFEDSEYYFATKLKRRRSFN